MLKKLMVGIILLCSITSYAQTTEIKKEKKFNHYVGLQANALLKQLFNLSNNNTGIITNPYTFTYAANHIKTGWGVHGGFGYDYQKTEDKLNPARPASKLNNVSFRAGAERKISLGKRFSASYGMDAVLNNLSNTTTTTSVFNFGGDTDSTVTVFRSKVSGYGGGMKFAINYGITEKVLLGTEVTGYYTKEKNKQNAESTRYLIDFFSGQTTTTYNNTNDETKTGKLGLTVPVVVYLIIKL